MEDPSLANGAGGVTNGRLGPTRRVGRQRPSLEGPQSLANDAHATHKRGNRAVPGGPPAVGALDAGRDPG